MCAHRPPQMMAGTAPNSSAALRRLWSVNAPLLLEALDGFLGQVGGTYWGLVGRTGDWWDALGAGGTCSEQLC